MNHGFPPLLKKGDLNFLKRAKLLPIFKIEGLVKSLPKRHPGESRGPELLGMTRFRLSPDLMLEKGRQVSDFRL